MFISAFISCDEKKGSFHLVREYDTAKLLHIVAAKEPPIKPSERYFFVSYQTSLKDNSQNSYGEVWFSCNSFPSKNSIDTVISQYLDHKLSCYQSIIITFMYELKDKEDYDSFNSNYSGDVKIKKKKSCKESHEHDFKLEEYKQPPTFRAFPSDSIMDIIIPLILALDSNDYKIKA